MAGTTDIFRPVPTSISWYMSFNFFREELKPSCPAAPNHLRGGRNANIILDPTRGCKRNFEKRIFGFSSAKTRP